jgi:hypothetical protein
VRHHRVKLKAVILGAFLTAAGGVNAIVAHPPLGLREQRSLDDTEYLFGLGFYCARPVLL